MKKNEYNYGSRVDESFDLINRLIPSIRDYINLSLPIELKDEEVFRYTGPWLDSFINFTRPIYQRVIDKNDLLNKPYRNVSIVNIPVYFGWLEWKILVQNHKINIERAIIISIQEYLQITSPKEKIYYLPVYREIAKTNSIKDRLKLFCIACFEKVYLFLCGSIDIAFIEVPISYKLKAILWLKYRVVNLRCLLPDPKCENNTSAVDNRKLNCSKFTGNDAYEQWLINNIHIFLPKAYTDMLAKIHEVAITLPSPRCIASDTLIFRNEYFNYWTIISARNNHCKNYIFGHGGGSACSFNREYEDIINDSSDKPVPNIKFFTSDKEQNPNYRSNQSIAVIVLPPDSYVTGYESKSCKYYQHPNNHKRILLVIEEVVNRGYKLILRPYPYGDILISLLTEELNARQIVYEISWPSKSPLSTLINQSNLNICTYPESCFTESLMKTNRTIHFECRRYDQYTNSHAINLLEKAKLWSRSICEFNHCLDSLDSLNELKYEARDVWLKSLNIGSIDDFYTWVASLKFSQ